MRILIAKEYEVGQIPVVGEYAIYKSGGKFFFAIGNGCTPVENLASGIEISEETFLSLKKNYKEFSLEKNSSSPSDEEKGDDNNKEKEKLFAVYLSLESFDIDSESSQGDSEDLRIYGKKVGLEEVAPYPCNKLKVYVLAETEEEGRKIAKNAFRNYLRDRLGETGEVKKEIR